MNAIVHCLRILGFAIAGGVIGCFATLLLSYLGLRFLSDHAATWMTVIGALNGVGAAFGWRYWVALGNDAADLVDEKCPGNECDKSKTEE